MKQTTKHYVICINNRGYKASLEVRKLYEVLADKESASLGLMRIIDESSEDYLYPASFFVPIRVPPKAQEVFTKPSGKRRGSASEIVA